MHDAEPEMDHTQDVDQTTSQDKTDDKMSKRETRDGDASTSTIVDKSESVTNGSAQEAYRDVGDKLIIDITRSIESMSRMVRLLSERVAGMEERF